MSNKPYQTNTNTLTHCLTAYTVLLPTYYNVNCKILYIRERERERERETDVGREMGEEVKGYAEIKAVMMDRV